MNNLKAGIAACYTRDCTKTRKSTLKGRILLVTIDQKMNLSNVLFNQIKVHRRLIMPVHVGIIKANCRTIVLFIRIGLLTNSIKIRLNFLRRQNYRENRQMNQIRESMLIYSNQSFLLEIIGRIRKKHSLSSRLKKGAIKCIRKEKTSC